MITFYLPEFYFRFRVYNRLMALVDSFPEYFKYNDLKIGALYGCFPNQKWNGGRAIVPNEFADINNITTTIDMINSNNVAVRFTYTNSLITEEHLDDIYCNFITNYANTGKNEILVNSPILEKYLREKYTNFKYISSATRCIRDIDKLNDMIDSGDYYLVLGDYRDNYDFDFLSKIKNKDKFEILINPYCYQDCKMRELHYKILDRIQLGLPEEEPYPYCRCEYMHWYELLQTNHVIKTEDLQKYIDMGFSHFKIEGRCVNPIDVIDSLVYYLVKDEYKDMVRNMLLFEEYEYNSKR